MSNLKGTLIIELLWTPISSPWGTLVGLSHQTWNMKHYKSVEFLSIFGMSIPLPKRKAPLLKTFWRRFCLNRSLKHLSEHSELHQELVLLLGVNTAENWKTSLCSGCGKYCRMDGAMQQYWLLRQPYQPSIGSAGNNAISQMFRDEQNKLGYCHRNSMAEVAKPIIMAKSVY